MYKHIEKSGKWKTAVCVEIGSLVFAVLNAIVTGLGTTVISVWLFQMTTKYIDGHRVNDLDSLVLAGFGAATVSAAIAFAFSIILLMGLVQKSPEYVKAYFVYGVMVSTASFAASVIKTIFFGSNFIEMGEVFVATGIFSAILAMIWARYKLLQEEIQYDQYHHVALSETALDIK